MKAIKFTIGMLRARAELHINLGARLTENPETQVHDIVAKRLLELANELEQVSLSGMSYA